MTPQRWARIKDVFSQALDREPPDRSAFLDDACADDPDLRAEVDRLLREHDLADDFLADDRAAPAPSSDAAPAARRIGPYEILDVIGEGGMGVVYLARQESPRRDVALKVIRPGLISRQTLRRFEHEAQILGRLQHHGIAQVYAAGTDETPDGPRPYFVMEYIHGQPLLEYVVRHNLTVRDRLALFAQIADAVHHAHQRGVIHRDLKPANILVVDDESQSLPARSQIGAQDVHQDLSGPDRMAESEASRQESVLSDRCDARSGEGQPDRSVAPSSRLDSLERRGGLRSPEPDRVCEVPQSSSGLPDGTAHAVDSRGGLGVSEGTERPDKSAVRNRSCAPGADSQPRKTQGALGRILPLRASVPSCLRASSAQPKILDFGVARVTEPDVRVTTMQTDVGQLIGTLAYMSPEQLTGDPAEIDTRADVYALGVILYEMLTGRLPFPVEGRSFVEATRLIRETDPVRLSTLSRALRGDVETIALKALAREKDRRYASAAELAADVRRYLASEPIGARPPSTIYQLRTFARRNRALVAGTVASFALLLLGIAGTSWQALAATRQRRIAQQHAADAETQAAKSARMNEFLVQLIGAAQPTHTKGKEVTIRDALDAASATVAESFKDSPEIEGSLRYIIGGTYADLSVYDAAQQHLEAAVSLLRTALGPDHPDTLNAINRLSLVYKDQGRLDLVEPLVLELLAARRRTLGDEHPDTLMSMNNTAMLLLLQGKPAEAEPLMRRAVELRRRILGPDHRSTIVSLDNLGRILDTLGRHEEAEAIYRESLADFARAQGEEDPDTLTARHNLAGLLAALGRYDEAFAEYRLLIDQRRRVLGPTHMFLASSIEGYARALMSAGRPAEAEPLCREIIPIALANFPPNHRYHAAYRGDLGQCLLLLGRHAEAEVELLAAYEALTTAVNASPTPAKSLVTERRRAIRHLADLYDATNRPADAARLRAELDAPAPAPASAPSTASAPAE